jgi:hypothetical protein
MSNSTTLKYADKSAGQPDLLPIFDAIKAVMVPYAKDDMKMQGGMNGQMQLVNKKSVVIEGKKKDEMWFAGLLIQKGYVGFYYMPIYADPAIGKNFSQVFMKCLKGKACFHIKKNDPQILAEIEKALRLGFDKWKALGWI